MFELKIKDIKRYEKSIQAFEAMPAEPGQILFYGSSGFTRWSPKYQHRPLEDDIRKKDGSPAAINRGFGGSTMEEGLYYYHRVVKPLAPRAIVLRFYPNDVASGYSPLEIVSLIAKFCDWARADFPGVKLFLCDAMPHQRHTNNALWHKLAKQFNRLLKEYCDANEDCSYVAQSSWRGFYTNPEEAGDYSKIRQDIWVEDQVHFTQEGYDIYRDLFLEALDEIL